MKINISVILPSLENCSVQLARRVLHLERANTSLRNEMEREKKKKDLLGKEVSFLLFIKVLQLFSPDWNSMAINVQVYRSLYMHWNMPCFVVLFIWRAFIMNLSEDEWNPLQGKIKFWNKFACFMNLLKMLLTSAILHILFLWDEKFTFSPLSYKLIVTIFEIILSFVFFCSAFQGNIVVKWSSTTIQLLDRKHKVTGYAKSVT